MTNDKELFKDLRPTNITKVWIGHCDYISVKERGTVGLTRYLGTKLISDVFFVPQIQQNRLSVSQLIERGFIVAFEVKMKGKSFALNPLEKKQANFPAIENIIEVWHKRLVHYDHQGLLQM